ncbi:hypothetical protein Ancab_005443 [Ancistrocladus abbreviatus]
MEAFCQLKTMQENNLSEDSVVFLVVGPALMVDYAEISQEFGPWMLVNRGLSKMGKSGLKETSAFIKKLTKETPLNHPELGGSRFTIHEEEVIDGPHKQNHREERLNPPKFTEPKPRKERTPRQGQLGECNILAQERLRLDALQQPLTVLVSAKGPLIDVSNLSIVLATGDTIGAFSGLEGEAMLPDHDLEHPGTLHLDIKRSLIVNSSSLSSQHCSIYLRPEEGHAVEIG